MSTTPEAPVGGDAAWRLSPAVALEQLQILAVATVRREIDMTQRPVSLFPLEGSVELTCWIDTATGAHTPASSTDAARILFKAELIHAAEPVPSPDDIEPSLNAFADLVGASAAWNGREVPSSVQNIGTLEHDLGPFTYMLEWILAAILPLPDQVTDWSLLLGDRSFRERQIRGMLWRAARGCGRQMWLPAAFAVADEIAQATTREMHPPGWGAEYPPAFRDFSRASTRESVELVLGNALAALSFVDVLDPDLFIRATALFTSTIAGRGQRDPAHLELARPALEHLQRSAMHPAADQWSSRHLIDLRAGWAIACDALVAGWAPIWRELPEVAEETEAMYAFRVLRMSVLAALAIGPCAASQRVADLVAGFSALGQPTESRSGGLAAKDIQAPGQMPGARA